MFVQAGGVRLHIRPHVVLAVFAAILLALVLSWVAYADVPVVEAAHRAVQPQHKSDGWHMPSFSKDSEHPIDGLIQEAHQQYSDLLEKETHTLREAAAAYRTKRGRHPPPRFDEWYQYAKSRDSIMIEDFFNRIYDDLEPFWGVDQTLIRIAASSGEETISIRNGAVTSKKESRPQLKQWHKMLQLLAKRLPDVDLFFNVHPEPRTYTSYERLSEYLDKAQTRGTLADTKPIDEIHERYPPLPHTGEKLQFNWNSNVKSLWSLTKHACPPTSPGRTSPQLGTVNSVPAFPKQPALSTRSGFVANWPIAKSPCSNPHLQGLHGNLIEPVNLMVSQDLFPIFGSAKTEVNNDILFPAAEYWDDPAENTDWFAWSRKKAVAFWRGPATGGRNRESNWRRFHRHRFVSMNNASQVNVALTSRGQFSSANGQSSNDAKNFPTQQLFWERHSQFALDSDDAESLQIQARDYQQALRMFPGWLSEHTDAAFTNLFCLNGDSKKCVYSDKFYETRDPIKTNKIFQNKFLPDVDGNGVSSRYRALLASDSVPIKATIFNEWHDSRLVPWKHFVPMHPDMMDYWGILQYFIGIDGLSEGHDAEARAIAHNGKTWAQRVLRREDMLTYVYRLVLEYARISSDDRENLGYVEDLRQPEATAQSFEVEKRWGRFMW